MKLLLPTTYLTVEVDTFSATYCSVYIVSTGIYQCFFVVVTLPVFL